MSHKNWAGISQSLTRGLHYRMFEKRSRAIKSCIAGHGLPTTDLKSRLILSTFTCFSSSNAYFRALIHGFKNQSARIENVEYLSGLINESIRLY